MCVNVALNSFQTGETKPRFNNNVVPDYHGEEFVYQQESQFSPTHKIEQSVCAPGGSMSCHQTRSCLEFEAIDGCCTLHLTTTGFVRYHKVDTFNCTSGTNFMVTKCALTGLFKFSETRLGFCLKLCSSDSHTERHKLIWVVSGDSSVTAEGFQVYISLHCLTESHFVHPGHWLLTSI